MQDNQLKNFVVDDTNYITNSTVKFQRRKKYIATDPNMLAALIPGTIRQIYVKKGDKVKKGDSLMILEAMKMMNDLKAPYNATIKNIFIKTGDTVMKGGLLLEFEDFN